MSTSSRETQQNLNEKADHTTSVGGLAESNADLLESAVALWSVLVSHASATVDAFKLDIKIGRASCRERV